MRSDIYPYSWFNPTKAELKASDIFAPIAFDMDGVLSETGGILREGIQNHYGVDDIRVEVDGYRTFNYHVPGVDQREMFDLVNHIIGEDSLGALPTPFMAECMEYFYDITDEPITIVTARVQENMGVTYQWLEHNFPVPFNLIMVNGMQKEVVLNRIKTDIFVDDRYKTIRNLEDYIAMPVLYERPWNQNRPAAAGAFSIRDLREMIPVFNMALQLRPMRWPGHIPYPNRMGRGDIEYA